jgi:ATP-dependent exoDNAse (exonuclease V) beta subunit
VKIGIIAASAGSGKTTRLSEVLDEAIASGKVRADGIVATTFTRQAAAELIERARSRLLPLQLAIFLELASLARESVWVGDQKQAIYGFRGTDPALMDAVIESLTATATDPELIRTAVEAVGHSGSIETLSTSYRSRPELVHELHARLAVRNVAKRAKLPSALHGAIPLAFGRPAIEQRDLLGRVRAIHAAAFHHLSSLC